jgi:hypothetical protein
MPINSWLMHIYEPPATTSHIQLQQSIGCYPSILTSKNLIMNTSTTK